MVMHGDGISYKFMMATTTPIIMIVMIPLVTIDDNGNDDIRRDAALRSVLLVPVDASTVPAVEVSLRPVVPVVVVEVVEVVEVVPPLPVLLLRVLLRVVLVLLRVLLRVLLLLLLRVYYNDSRQGRRGVYY